MWGRHKAAKHRITAVVWCTECTKSIYGPCSEDDFYRADFSMYPAAGSPLSASIAFQPISVVSLLGLTQHCRPHLALRSSGDRYFSVLVRWPSALLCLDRWSSALQTSATTLLLWGLRGLSGAAHYPLFPPSPLPPSPLHGRKSVSGCGQPRTFMSDWTRRPAVNAGHNMALTDLLIDLEMPGKLRLWEFEALWV